MEYENLLTQQGIVRHFQVAEKYFSTDNVSRTKTFLAFLDSMAVRIQAETLRAKGKIMNSEDPAICLKIDMVKMTTETVELLSKWLEIV